MFGRKKGWTRSKNPDSKRYKNDMAEHLNGMPLKCVCEKVRDGELMLYAGMDIVFRCDVLSMSAWELMSLDGVVITAPDLEHGGTERTVTAYYSYWRSMNE